MQFVSCGGDLGSSCLDVVSFWAVSLSFSYPTPPLDFLKYLESATYRPFWAIPCAGATVGSPRHRSEWLAKISEPGVRLRAEGFYQRLDLLQPLRQAARCEFVMESHKHPAVKLLRQIPSIGPIRAALLVAAANTHVFAPSDSSGRTAGSPSKLTTAASTAMFVARRFATGNASAFEG